MVHFIGGKPLNSHGSGQGGDTCQEAGWHGGRMAEDNGGGQKPGQRWSRTADLGIYTKARV